MQRLWYSVFGLGYAPVAPGTFGSAAVAGVFLAVVWGGGSAVTVAAVMLAVALLGGWATVRYGEGAIAKLGPDPSQIVSDEACGQAITYLWLWELSRDNPGQVLVLTGAGFLLFRAFDIVKPPPVRQLERVKGAWGVLLDDIMAGVYANVVLQVLWRLGVLG